MRWVCHTVSLWLPIMATFSNDPPSLLRHLFLLPSLASTRPTQAHVHPPPPTSLEAMRGCLTATEAFAAREMAPVRKDMVVVVCVGVCVVVVDVVVVLPVE